MNAIVKQVTDRLEALPEETREHVAREIVAYLDKLERLRADIDEGIRSIERGEGRPLDIEDILKRARAKREGLSG